jgi:hypothetical protein
MIVVGGDGKTYVNLSILILVFILVYRAMLSAAQIIRHSVEQ